MNALLSAYRSAAERAQRPLLAVLAEAVRRRLGPQRLGLTEFLDYQLEQDDLDASAKSAFIGQRLQMRLEELLIDDLQRFVALDKLTMYTLMAGYRLPVPTLYAVYRSVRPRSVPQLADAAALERFFAAEPARPVYLKRAYGAYGRGNRLVQQRGPDGRLQLADGACLTAAELAGQLDEGAGLGWLLQEPLRAHPAIEALTGTDKVSGLRLHSFWVNGRVELLPSVFKVNAGRLDSDNFAHGRSGNLLAAVDLASGRLTRVIAGTGAGQRIDPPHPVTGARLSGFQLPHWPQVLELVRDAHAAFPGFLCPGWDVALCADGPRLLEVNAFGDVDLPQHAHRRGFLDAGLLALLRERGLLDAFWAREPWHAPVARNGRTGVRRAHWPW